MALIDENGHPLLGKSSGPGVPRATVTERIRTDRAETTVELTQRRLDTVDLIIQGATVRQVAERHGIGVDEAREDYQVGMRALNDASMDRCRDMREEVTARQRSLVLANMGRARAGDAKAAAIVQRADQMLVDIWGLRYVKPDMEEPEHSPVIAAALHAYLAKVAERVGLAS